MQSRYMVYLKQKITWNPMLTSKIIRVSKADDHVDLITLSKQKIARLFPCLDVAFATVRKSSGPAASLSLFLQLVL